MKRFFVFLMVMLLSCSFAFSEDTDPIIGCWYADMTLNEDIILAGTEEYIRAVMILSFEENNSIISIEIDYDGINANIIGPSVVGKWEKISEGEYSLKILGLGTQTAYLDDDILAAIVATKDYYCNLHKMILFDWYEDLYRKQ